MTTKPRFTNVYFIGPDRDFPEYISESNAILWAGKTVAYFTAQLGDADRLGGVVLTSNGRLACYTQEHGELFLECSGDSIDPQVSTNAITDLINMTCHPMKITSITVVGVPA